MGSGHRFVDGLSGRGRGQRCHHGAGAMASDADDGSGIRTLPSAESADRVARNKLFPPSDRECRPLDSICHTALSGRAHGDRVLRQGGEQTLQSARYEGHINHGAGHEHRRAGRGHIVRMYGNERGVGSRISALRHRVRIVCGDDGGASIRHKVRRPIRTPHQGRSLGRHNPYSHRRQGAGRTTSTVLPRRTNQVRCRRYSRR